MEVGFKNTWKLMQTWLLAHRGDCELIWRKVLGLFAFALFLFSLVET